MPDIQEAGNQEQEALELSLIERATAPLDQERAEEIGMDIKEVENFRDLAETISTAEREGLIRRVMPEDPDAQDADFYRQRIKFYTGQLKEKSLPLQAQQKCREELKAISRMFFSITNPRTSEQRDYFPSARLPHILERGVKEKMTSEQQGVVRENFSIGGRIIKELNDKRTELARREIAEREQTREFRKQEVRPLTEILQDSQSSTTAFDTNYFDISTRYHGVLKAETAQREGKTYLSLSAGSGNIGELLAKIGEENTRDILCESFENKDGRFFRFSKNGKRLAEDEKLKPLHIILSRQLRNEERTTLEKDLREQEKNLLGQSTVESLSELKDDKEGAFAFHWTETRKTVVNGKEKIFANKGVVVVTRQKKGNNFVQEAKVYGPLKQQLRFEHDKLLQILQKKKKQEQAEKTKSPWLEKEAADAVAKTLAYEQLIKASREAARDLIRATLKRIDDIDLEIDKIDMQVAKTSDIDEATKLEDERHKKEDDRENIRISVCKQLKLDPKDPNIVLIAGTNKERKNTMSVVRLTKNDKGEEVEEEVFTTIV